MYISCLKNSEIFVIALIGVTTFLGVLAAYHSTLCSEESIVSYKKAIMTITDSNTEYQQAKQEIQANLQAQMETYGSTDSEITQEEKVYQEKMAELIYFLGSPNPCPLSFPQ